ncbi:MAG: hypothetical protein AAGI70_08325 [Pseudomonadota bacterium]
MSDDKKAPEKLSDEEAGDAVGGGLIQKHGIPVRPESSEVSDLVKRGFNPQPEPPPVAMKTKFTR